MAVSFLFVDELVEVLFGGDWVDDIFCCTSTDARALFERLVLRFPAEKARPIWDAWSRYEYLYGDIESAQKLDSRLKEAYPNGQS